MRALRQWLDEEFNLAIKVLYRLVEVNSSTAESSSQNIATLHREQSSLQ
ncbi:MAG: hypothetical protein ACM3ZE_02485 [Myxococcales bacterium]